MGDAMKKILELPHRKEEATCYINGLYDILTWYGVSYEYFILPIIGGMAGFSFMQFKKADPPKMVYWGNSPKYLLKELAEIINYKEIILEGKIWKSTFPIIIELLQNNTPILAGALDMYYLHYYTDIYNTTHIPIHYVLIIGFNDEEKLFYIHDCSHDSIQEISYDALEKALSINVPGMSKKNTIRFFKLPDSLPSEIEVTEKGFAYKAKRMLNPPTNMIGIPAMRKLAGDIISWDCKKCIYHMVAYAGNCPPLIPHDISDCNALRFKESELLKTLGEKYNNTKYIEAGISFEESGKLIIQFCKKAINNELKACSDLLLNIADVEEKVFQLF